MTEVVLWQNDDEEWNDEEDKEQVVFVHQLSDNPYNAIRMDTNYGFVDWPSLYNKDRLHVLRMDFPEKFSNACRSVAYEALFLYKELSELNKYLFGDNKFTVLKDTKDSRRYDQLLGFFFPQYRNNVWAEVYHTQIVIYWMPDNWKIGGSDWACEVVMWTEDEWKEDPTIVPAIANAIRMAYAEPEKLLEINKKHIDSQIAIRNSYG